MSESEPNPPRHLTSYVINSTCVRLMWTIPLNNDTNTMEDVDVSDVILMHGHMYVSKLSQHTYMVAIYVCIIQINVLRMKQYYNTNNNVPKHKYSLPTYNTCDILQPCRHCTIFNK